MPVAEVDQGIEKAGLNDHNLNQATAKRARRGLAAQTPARMPGASHSSCTD